MKGGIGGPELNDVMIVQMKRAVRRRMASVRQALPLTARNARSQLIVNLIASSPAFRAAQGVALYAAMVDRGEVDVTGLDALCRAAGKRVYYPFMTATDSGHTTGFRQVRDPVELQQRDNRFAEPDPEVPPASSGEIDFIIVPALAAALTGHRIGSGSGFYDVTLPDFPNATRCVVVFSFQLIAEVPSEPHDMACQLVCSDAGLVEAEPAS